MAEGMDITAQPREIVGKTSRRLVAEGKLPAVLYGQGLVPTSLSLDKRDFDKMYKHGGITSTLVMLHVEGREPVNVIVKEVRLDPVRGSIEHVNFQAVDMKAELHTSVSIHFVGQAVGERTGGVLMHTLRELHIAALPSDLPENLEADVSALEIGDNLHVSDIPVPAGVTVLDELDAIVCSVAAPSLAIEEEEVVGEEEPEPEVIGSGEEEA